MTKEPPGTDQNYLLKIYSALYSSLKEKNYDKFCLLIDAPDGEKMPKKDWTTDNISMLLSIMPDPSKLKFLKVASLPKTIHYGYQFRFNEPDEEGAFNYGMIFFRSTKEGLKFSRVLMKNISVDDKKKLDSTILSELSTDLDFALNETDRSKRESKIVSQKEVSNSNELILKNEYEKGWTPSVVFTCPKNWFDMNSSGNSTSGDFETLVMGGIGFSEDGSSNYSTKKKMQFGICLSKKALADFSSTLKTSKFSIKEVSKDSFEALKKDDFWGNQYLLVKKIDKGFLVGMVNAELDDDFAFSKKALLELFPKLKIKF